MLYLNVMATVRKLARANSVQSGKQRMMYFYTTLLRTIRERDKSFFAIYGIQIQVVLCRFVGDLMEKS